VERIVLPEFVKKKKKEREREKKKKEEKNERILTRGTDNPRLLFEDQAFGRSVVPATGARTDVAIILADVRPVFPAVRLNGIWGSAN